MIVVVKQLTIVRTSYSFRHDSTNIHKRGNTIFPLLWVKSLFLSFRILRIYYVFFNITTIYHLRSNVDYLELTVSCGIVGTVWGQTQGSEVCLKPYVIHVLVAKHLLTYVFKNVLTYLTEFYTTVPFSPGRRRLGTLQPDTLYQRLSLDRGFGRSFLTEGRRVGLSVWKVLILIGRTGWVPGRRGASVSSVRTPEVYSPPPTPNCLPTPRSPQENQSLDLFGPTPLRLRDLTSSLRRVQWRVKGP